MAPKLEDQRIAIDPTSGQKNEHCPRTTPFPRCDVTAPLIYVNYGLVDDYEQLRGRNRRQGSHRVWRVMVTRGAAFKPSWRRSTEPWDALFFPIRLTYGFREDAVFPMDPCVRPRRAARPACSMRRSTPGDPLTPGVGATADAKRLKREDAASLAKFPLFPFYGDAQLCWRHWRTRGAGKLARSAAFDLSHWALDYKGFTCSSRINWDLKPVNDVIATMRGSEEPDVWILRANHHDGWVNGAAVQISGQVALLEEARALGQLPNPAGSRSAPSSIARGWRRADAAGLNRMGWEHAEELKAHAAIYINSDGNDRGYLAAAGSHSLEPLVNQVARAIDDPETHATVWSRWQAGALVSGTVQAQKEATARATCRIGELGSGSDFQLSSTAWELLRSMCPMEAKTMTAFTTPFYDDFYWYTALCRHQFRLWRALAQTNGTLVLRMAQADCFLRFSHWQIRCTRHKRIEGAARNAAHRAEQRKAALNANAYALTRTPGIRWSFRCVGDSALPNFAAPRKALTALDKAAAHFSQPVQKQAVRRAGRTPEALTKARAGRAQAHQPRRIARRPWMQHLIYAPGWYTGLRMQKRFRVRAKP